MKINLFIWIGCFTFVVLLLRDQMLQIQKNIHVGGYRITPSSIGSLDGNFLTWCSEGTSSPDLSRTKKPTIFYQTNLSMVSAGSDLTVSTCDLMILSTIDRRVKAGYDKSQKGCASGKCWVN
jgi:hypothetical protein